MGFDFTHSTGIVINLKPAYIDDISDYDYDVLVYWSDGEIFWCADFTLTHVLADHY